MDLGLDGKVALVCGSSTGLGLAIARTLASEGCRVALNGRNDDRLTAAVEEMRLDPAAQVQGFAADVSVPREAEDLVRRVRTHFDHPDILICNAGGPPSTRFADTAVDGWQQALELNLLSTIHLCRAAVPSMREREWGRVVCLASVAGKQPLPGLILSTTARAGVLGFAKALADEVAADGVTVNVVCPGYMRTERVTDLIAERATREGRTAEEITAALVEAIPKRRIGEPHELAAAVTFLASDRAGYITGVALQVDGGYVRSIV